MRLLRPIWKLNVSLTFTTPSASTWHASTASMPAIPCSNGNQQTQRIRYTPHIQYIHMLYTQAHTNHTPHRHTRIPHRHTHSPHAGTHTHTTYRHTHTPHRQAHTHTPNTGTHTHSTQVHNKSLYQKCSSKLCLQNHNTPYHDTNHPWSGHTCTTHTNLLTMTLSSDRPRATQPCTLPPRVKSTWSKLFP